MKRVEDGVGCCIVRIQIFIIAVKKTTSVLCCEKFFFSLIGQSVRGLILGICQMSHLQMLLLTHLITPR